MPGVLRDRTALRHRARRADRRLRSPATGEQYGCDAHAYRVAARLQVLHLSIPRFGQSQWRGARA